MDVVLLGVQHDAGRVERTKPGGKADAAGEGNEDVLAGRGCEAGVVGAAWAADPEDDNGDGDGKAGERHRVAGEASDRCAGTDAGPPLASRMLQTKPRANEFAHATRRRSRVLILAA